MSLKDTMDRISRENGRTDFKFFKFDESGKTYKFRVLTEPLAMSSHYFGSGAKPSICYGKLKGCPFHLPEHDNPTAKFACYVLDRADGKIKIAELAWSIISVLSDYEKDAEWSFDSYPMPYDINVTYDKTSSDKRQIYKTIGSPTRSMLDVQQTKSLLELEQSSSIASYVEKRKARQIEEHKSSGIWVTDEERARREEKRRAEAIAVAESMGIEESKIDYPTEETGEDIPF